jgi:hypothetical protein
VNSRFGAADRRPAGVVGIVCIPGPKAASSHPPYRSTPPGPVRGPALPRAEAPQVVATSTTS